MSEEKGESGAVGARMQSFHELMRDRVQRILLVSNLYDSFIMSEEGQLQETLLSQFLELNLANIPDLIQVGSGAKAVELLRGDDDFDLVLTSAHQRSGDVEVLAEGLSAAGLSIPVVGLAYTNRELVDFIEAGGRELVHRLFLWQGDTRILVAIVKHLEDRLNAENDIGRHGVPAIIVVEDSIRFYSSFLPAIYAELLSYTQRLLSAELNVSQKILRMRARPRVLLCETYEEAWRDFERFGDHVIGIVSDIEYPREGRLDPQAGLALCSRVLERRPDIRVVLQSSRAENRIDAERLGASFLLKGSATLLIDLRTILTDRFGFGDFVFRDEQGNPAGRAADLDELARMLAVVPGESLAYHASRNHFSNWLKARTEFRIAERLRPRKLEEFATIEELRQHLLDELRLHRRERLRSVISDYDRSRFEPEATLTRLGAGALGGKARGVAFANRILRDAAVEEQFPGIDVHVPASVVIGTQVFDEFLEYGELRDRAIASRNDDEVEQLFLEAPFPRQAVADLRTFVQRVKHPLAVRSSSLLEDSLSQPFAGVYTTYMLPNNDPQVDVRWRQLVAAVKRVYASVFSMRAKGYLAMTSFRLEEEKMAVMIQELVGRSYRDHFYPDFAGVARSYNFYPEPGQEAEDGVAAVALGLGRTVVSGNPCLRFCPKFPRNLVAFSSVQAALSSSQRDFYALDLRRGERDAELPGVHTYDLARAEEDGVLAWVGSTYLHDDDRIVDGVSRAGVRLVSFAQVLKHESFPLAEILRVLLARCTEGMGGPVEIEFAGNLPRSSRERGRFGFLQLRPLALSGEQEEVRIGDVAEVDVLCRASKVLGNGRLEDIHDVVTVDVEDFDRSRTLEVAAEVAYFDAVLRKAGRPYVLVGVGRWGSADPSLGIPVSWNQIAGARVIVEAGFKDLAVSPSQGTHFFQNLTSSNVGYFTVNPDHGDGFVDWAWLSEQEPVESTDSLRHLRFDDPLVVVMSGHTSEGVILKP